MNRLLLDYREYMERVKRNGGKVFSVPMPCCGETIEMRKPPKGRVWDSLMTCPHCGTLMFHVTTSAGISFRSLPA